MADVELRTAGKIFAGWTTININRSIESLSGYFELGVNVQPETDLSSLSPGQPFTLTINGQTVITGYLDGRRRNMTADSMSITISGRDKTADLIDCAAIYQGRQWKGRTLEQIARDLCGPYKVTVRWELTDSESSAPFPSFTLDYSETVYEALGRASRARGVLMTSNAAGELVFTRLRKNYGRFTSHIIVKTSVDNRNATVLDNCLTPLVVYSGGVIECLLEKYKPAHQVFIYIYQ